MLVPDFYRSFLTPRMIVSLVMAAILGLLSAVCLALGFSFLLVSISSFMGDSGNVGLANIVYGYFPSYEMLEFLLLALAALAVGEFMFYLSQILGVVVGQSVIVRMRREIACKVLEKSWVGGVDGLTPGLVFGEWCGAAGAGIESVSRCVANGLIAISLMLYCLSLNTQSFVVALLFGGIVFLVQHFVFRQYSRAAKHLIGERHKTSEFGLALSLNSGIYKDFGLGQVGVVRSEERWMQDRHAALMQQIFHYGSPLTSKILALGVFGTILFLSVDVWNLEISVILAQVVALRRVSAAINQLNLAALEVSKSASFVHRILGFLESLEVRLKVFPVNLASVCVVVADGGSLSIDAVTLGGKKVQLHTPLICRPENVTAIFGPSGSGKSTLLRGVVEGLRGADLSVCLVSQNQTNFSGTVKENLRFGHKKEVTAELLALIIEYRVVSGIVDEMSVERFFSNCDRIVSDETLSGGQTQRLALVRAILLRPRVLLLDEITSAQDPSMELQMLELIRQFCKLTGCICIMTAHRAAIGDYIDSRVDIHANLSGELSLLVS